MGKIDFHTHILPGVDDGAKTVEESIALLDLLAEQGVQMAVLTPHFYAHRHTPQRFLEKRESAWNAILPYLTQRHPKLYLGAEVQYFEGISRVEAMSSLKIQGTQLLLLEMPFCQWTERIMEEVLQLHRQGDFQVMLAHIERYLSMQPRGTVDRMLEEGVLIQSNLEFFVDWRTRRKAKRMLERGMIHALGSDCHGLKKRKPIWDRLPKKLVLQEELEKSLFAACESALYEKAKMFHQEACC